MTGRNYGKELVLDLHNCNPQLFTRRKIRRLFEEICSSTILDMERCELHFWDYENDKEAYKKAPDHLKGTSAIQFITTSNITIHTLDEMQKVYLNIFSCKDFDADRATEFCKEYFQGDVVNNQLIVRK